MLELQAKDWIPPVIGLAGGLLAGLIATISAVIGKENKISEFRQAWIDAQRDDLATLTSEAVAYVGETDPSKKIGRLASFDAAHFRVELREDPDKEEWTNPSGCSGSAKSCVNPLVGQRRFNIGLGLGLVGKRAGKHFDQSRERRKVCVLDGRRDHLLDPVIPRNESRVHRVHRDLSRCGILRFLRQARAPANRPGVVATDLKERTDTGIAVVPDGGLGEPAKEEREIGLVRGHRREDRAGKIGVVGLCGEQSQFAAQACLVGQREAIAEGLPAPPPHRRWLSAGPHPVAVAASRRASSDSTAQGAAGCHTHSVPVDRSS
jgi:hypothetical protein